MRHQALRRRPYQDGERAELVGVGGALGLPVLASEGLVGVLLLDGRSTLARQVSSVGR
jgi:hypothetical protein